MMVGDGQRDHLGRGTFSPTQAVEFVTDLHTAHTHSFDFSIFVRLTSGLQPLDVKNENEKSILLHLSAFLC